MGAVLLLNSVYAQKKVTIPEDTLIAFMQRGKIVDCKEDQISDGLFSKTITIEPRDKPFVSIYITSSLYTKSLYAFGFYEVDFVWLDDGCDGKNLYEEDLENVRYLKAYIDILIRETPFMKYSGEYPNTDY